MVGRFWPSFGALWTAGSSAPTTLFCSFLNQGGVLPCRISLDPVGWRTSPVLRVVFSHGRFFFLQPRQPGAPPGAGFRPLAIFRPVLLTLIVCTMRESSVSHVKVVFFAFRSAGDSYVASCLPSVTDEQVAFLRTRRLIDFSVARAYVLA